MAVTIDGDRMRVNVRFASGDAALVRLESCNADAAEEGCGIDAVWLRLSEERGRPINPSWPPSGR